MVTTDERTQTPLLPAHGDDDPESDDKRMTIQEHLEELRTRLIISVAAIIVGMIPGVFLATPIWNIMRRLLDTQYQIVVGGVIDGFMAWLYIALGVGAAVASPVVIYQIAAFVAPALTRQEKRFLIAVLPSVVLLFFLGAAFCYFVVLPTALNFLVGHVYVWTPDVTPLIQLSNYMEFIFTLTFWCGVSFETPVVIVALKRVRILNNQRIRAVRRYFIVFAFVAAAFITPTPDVLTQILVAVPIILLFEIGVLIGNIVAPDRDEQEQRDRNRTGDGGTA